MVLLIDNYDSFTYNLVHRLLEVEPGLAVEVVRHDQITPEAAEAARPSHVILSPGPCGPAEAGASCAVIRRLAGRVPILGVCLGHQCIAHAFGLPVVRAPRPVHGSPADVHHGGQGVFSGLPSPFPAARYHSLVVPTAAVESSPEWQVTAWAHEPDGTRLVMAMRRRWGPARPAAELIGLQFHPESFMTPHGHAILRGFLAARPPGASVPGGAVAARPGGEVGGEGGDILPGATIRSSG
ncbi:MAG TPA: aminodeoxychorismate/anthranilate synthase component II [Phycisphaerales bacterium]|nr:aminodeoxychorismate/anthranilate synthase component II [Phycisphaerales bacterium]